MSAERTLAWFSVAISGILMLAFGADGWSPWELAAVISFPAAALLFWLLHNYLEPFRDWLLGVGNTVIRPARESDVDAIHTIGCQHFGSSITDKDTIRSLIKRNRKIFWVMDGKSHDGTVSTICGYGCIYPLNSDQTDLMERGHFSLTALAAENLLRSRARPKSVYIGAIAANGWRIRAGMLSHVELLATEAARRTETRVVYAKAVTNPGLRLVKRRQFEPVIPHMDGMNTFWRKRVEAA